MGYRHFNGGADIYGAKKLSLNVQASGGAVLIRHLYTDRDGFTFKAVDKMTNKILRLTLKKKWFDMIASGEKKEEYREIKKYWIDRLAYEFCFIHDEAGFRYEFKPKQFSVVRFTNGYGKDAPFIDKAINEIRIDTGVDDWGAEPMMAYFVIDLHDRFPAHLMDLTP